MKNLILYFKEPELRHVRATRDVKFLQTAVNKLDAIIPALNNLAQMTAADFDRHEPVYRELVKFGSTCAELSTRRTQVGDLHPELHWPLITGFTPYFNHLIANKTVIGTSELTALADDLFSLKNNFIQLVTESQKIATQSAELQQQYELAMEQHEANRRLFKLVLAASNFINEIPYDISANDFAGQYAATFQEHIRYVNDALIELDNLDLNAVTKILPFNSRAVNAAIDLMREYPKKFALKDLQNALRAARDETRENLCLDIQKPGKEQGGSVRTYKVAAGMELLIKPYSCDYYRKLVIDKIKEFTRDVSTSKIRTLQERAALLRLLAIAGEAAKQLIHYDSLPNLKPTLEVLVEIRNDIAHGFDDEQGRNGLYELLVSADNSVATFFDKVTQLLTGLVSEMESANSVLDVKSVMQLASELRSKLSGSSTNSTKQQFDFSHDLPSIGHYLVLAGTLDIHDPNAVSQLAAEFYLMAVGAMLKDFETDQNAQIEADKLTRFTDLITLLIDMRNGLAHELYQLGYLYKSEVLPMLRVVISEKANFNILDANLIAARAIQQETATVHTLQQSSESAERDFGNLHFRLTSGTAAKRRESERTVHTGLETFVKQVTMLTAASLSLSETEIEPAMLKVVNDTVVKQISPSKYYNLSSPVKASLREHRDTPSAFLLLGFRERIQQLIAIHTNSTSAIAAATSASAFLTPTKPTVMSRMAGEIDQSGALVVSRVRTTTARRIEFGSDEQNDSARNMIAAGLSKYGVPLPTTPDAKLKLQPKSKF